MTAANPLADVLDWTVETIERHIVIGKHQAVALALWCAHTWAIASFSITPYLIVTAPTKRAGKTRLLELLALLVRQPVRTLDLTAAATFRLIEAKSPTLLIDEGDAVFRARGDEGAQALRSVLNAGHERGAKVIRNERKGSGFELVEFEVFCPKAIAGIGDFAPDTVRDRSIVIGLDRKLPSEKVAKLRKRDRDAIASTVGEALAAAMAAVADQLEDAEPDVPAVLNDRAADGWEPLLAVADCAGGPWPGRARAAAVALSGADDPATDTLAVRLLADIRTVAGDTDRLFTRDLLARLHGLEDAPWGEWMVTGRRVADLLRGFGIRRRDIRIGTDHGKGYVLADFRNAFQRYLPPDDQPPPDPVSPIPPIPIGDIGDNPSAPRDSADSQSVTTPPRVTDYKTSETVAPQHLSPMSPITGGDKAGNGEIVTRDDITDPDEIVRHVLETFPGSEVISQ